LRVIAGASPRALRGALSIAEELLGKGRIDERLEALTFQQVGEEWTSGKLHERFPDHVNKLSPEFLETVKQRLDKGIYPVIGDEPVTTLNRSMCDEVMRRLPIPKGKTELSRETRRQYAGLIHRVLNLAELAGYIDRNPLPRGWLPKVGAKKRFPILYPSEDRTLLAWNDDKARAEGATGKHPGIPLAYRVFYGFLHREGMRRSEAALLQWRDLDLEHGTVNLDENKTDHPRWWKLAPGVAEALEDWWARCGEPASDARVFTDEHGRPLTLDHLAETTRAHLRKAGLDRADLYSTGPNKGAFGPHCFRRSFVTRSLALGKNEDFVRQRTGHKSGELLTYRLAAKALAELDLSELEPLTSALPDCPGIAPRITREGGGTGRRASLRC